MRKFLLIILSILLLSCENNLKEPTTYYTLPQVKKQNLNTTENNFLYPIRVEDLYGFIDINGELKIEPKFKAYEILEKGYYVTHMEEEDVVPDDQNHSFPKRSTYMIIPGFKEIKISDNDVYLNLTTDKKYAMIHEYLYENEKEINKSFILNMETKEIFDKSDESHKVVNAYDDCYITQNSGLFYITDYNKQNLSSAYTSYEGLQDDTFFFKNGSGLYWLDKSGNVIFEYDNANYGLPFYNDIAPVVDNNSNLMFVDKNGNILNTYQNVNSIFKKDNVYIAFIGQDVVILDNNGARKIPEDYGGRLDHYYDLQKSIIGYHKNNSSYDVFDKDGNIKASYTIPDGFTNPMLIDTDYVRLEKDTVCGLGEFKDGNMQWVLEPKYSYIDTYDVIKPYAMVFIQDSNKSYNSYAGLYDLESRKFVLEPKYLHVSVFDKDMIYVETAFFTGFINSKGDYVFVQPIYDFESDG